MVTKFCFGRRHENSDWRSGSDGFLGFWLVHANAHAHMCFCWLFLAGCIACLIALHIDLLDCLLDVDVVNDSNLDLLLVVVVRLDNVQWTLKMCGNRKVGNAVPKMNHASKQMTMPCLEF